MENWNEKGKIISWYSDSAVEGDDFSFIKQKLVAKWRQRKARNHCIQLQQGLFTSIVNWGNMILKASFNYVYLYTEENMLHETPVA